MENIAIEQLDENPLVNLSMISEKMGIAVLSSGIYEKTEFHCPKVIRNHYTLMLTLGGTAWVKQGNKRRYLKRGDWFLLAPNLRSSYHNLTPWSMAFLHFKGQYIDMLIHELSFFKRDNLCFRQSDKRSEQTLMKIIGISKRNTIVDEIRRNGLLIELISTLCGYYTRKDSEKDPLADVQEYILKNVKLRIQLDKLARKAHMSKYHFIRVFKQKFGYTPVQYIQRLKIEVAKKYLRDPKPVKINEVANFLGFNDSLYFCKVFKRWTNMTPKAFRQEILSNTKK